MAEWNKGRQKCLQSEAIYFRFLTIEKMSGSPTVAFYGIPLTENLSSTRNAIQKDC